MPLDTGFLLCFPLVSDKFTKTFILLNDRGYVCSWYHLGIGLVHVQPNPELQVQGSPLCLSLSTQKTGNHKYLNYCEYLKCNFLQQLWGEWEKGVALVSIYRVPLLISVSLSAHQGMMMAF